jgi:hypothetical protein
MPIVGAQREKNPLQFRPKRGYNVDLDGQGRSGHNSLSDASTSVSENAHSRLGLNIADPAKVGVSIVGLLYALGFLVVTFHLSEFGVAPVTWLRPQYLLAGIWCLLPLLIFTCGFALAAMQFSEPWIRYSLVVPRRTRRYRYIVGAFQGCIMLVTVFVFVSIVIAGLDAPFALIAKRAGHGFDRLGPSSIITLKLGGLFLLIAACVFWAKASFSSMAHSPVEQVRMDRRLAFFSSGLMGVFASLVFAVLYVYSFSVLVYSVIPLELGGGRPQSVVFLIDSAKQQTPPLVVDSSGTRSVPYNLLLITDSNYVVESPAKGEMAIEFKQDSVRGMIVLR